MNTKNIPTILFFNFVYCVFLFISIIITLTQQYNNSFESIKSILIIYSFISVFKYIVSLTIAGYKNLERFSNVPIMIIVFQTLMFGGMIITMNIMNNSLDLKTNVTYTFGSLYVLSVAIDTFCWYILIKDKDTYTYIDTDNTTYSKLPI